jgi:hypothetical protein
MFFQNKNKPCVILTKSKIMNMDITTSLLGDVSNLIDRAKNHLSVQFNSIQLYSSIVKLGNWLQN